MEKQKLIDKVLEIIKEDVAHEDFSAIEELIKNCPEENLINFLPEN